MLRIAVAAALAAALTGCGLAHADRVNGLTRQELAHESDRSICHAFVNSPAAMAERQARGLGDCSQVTLKCREMGYPIGHPQYLQCRQTLAQEDAAAAAHAAAAASAAAAAAAATPQPRAPTICNRVGNSVFCN
jgi:hypothetical protein